MSDELLRLYNSHSFVHRALTEHGHSLAPPDFAHLARERDELFLELVNFTSTDPRVTLAQVRYLLTSLAAISSNADQAELLRKACLGAVDRLATNSRAPQTLQERTFAHASSADRYPPQSIRELLDNMSDRIGIADREYRYVFTNRSNANFHQRPQSGMEQLPIVAVVGPSIFKDFTKPSLDLCFAGKSVTRYLRFHSASRPRLSSTRIDPIYDQEGAIRWAMMTIRDVSGVPIPSELLTELIE